MALIKCAECGKEISDQAAACPNCGNPVGMRAVTIQRTHKRWKIGIIIAVVLIFLGLAYLGSNSGLGITFLVLVF
jgi:DNA-directed RNA polymerase subunit RPC12/RpoP